MAEPGAQPRFREVRRLASGVFRETLRGIAESAGRIYAVGDSTVCVFDAAGERVRTWDTERPGHSVAVDAAGRVWVGQSAQVAVYDAEGRPVATHRDGERLGLVTAVAVRQSDFLLADASARCIRRYDREGRWLNNVGDRHRKGGFHIPNGVVDFALDTEGVIHVANPGMHRVERYTAEGRLLGHFGRFDGRDPAGFPGCCNPTNLALDSDGRIVVTEKAGPRVKLYDRDGGLLAVVGADEFDPAAKNMDVAVDASGRIYVADPVGLEIHVFETRAQEGPG